VKSDRIARAARVLAVEAAAIDGLREKIDERFARAVDLLRVARGKVVVTGMGKSGLIARKIAATMASTGTPAFFLHAADGIHLNDLGQLAMGFVMIKGLGGPAEVSSAVIDAKPLQAVSAEGCRIEKCKREAGTLEFTRTDEGLPLNFGPLGALNFRFIPIPNELNRYMLAVRNLEPGKYDLKVDGRPVGTWTHEQLAAGINISSATPDGWIPGGPWDAQAALLKMITQSRNELAQCQKTAVYYLGPEAASEPAGVQAARINSEIEQLQRETARPRPYRFVLSAAGEGKQ